MPKTPRITNRKPWDYLLLNYYCTVELNSIPISSPPLGDMCVKLKLKLKSNYTHLVEYRNSLAFASNQSACLIVILRFRDLWSEQLSSKTRNCDNNHGPVLKFRTNDSTLISWFFDVESKQQNVFVCRRTPTLLAARFARGFQKARSSTTTTGIG